VHCKLAAVARTLDPYAQHSAQVVGFWGGGGYLTEMATSSNIQPPVVTVVNSAMHRREFYLKQTSFTTTVDPLVAMVCEKSMGGRGGGILPRYSVCRSQDVDLSTRHNVLFVLLSQLM
jgi:hypothetical protein